MNNVGQLSVLLVRCCFFGYDILQVYTLNGNGNRHGLDPHKLQSLITEIHGQAFRHMSQEGFTATIQQKSRASFAGLSKAESVGKETGLV